MTTGRVVRFDSSRGYGFVAPDEGGEDVFLHVNDMLIPEHLVSSGTLVEFEIADGDRGPKATGVQLAAGAPAPRPVPRPAPAQGDAEPGMCDVLTPEEYTAEITETLLTAAPSLTGEQILRIRGGLLEVAKRYGWAEG